MHSRDHQVTPAIRTGFCENMRTSSIKQTNLNKQGSTHKKTSYK